MFSSPATSSKSKMRPMFSWSSTAYRRASYEQAHVLGILRMSELLDDDRALESGLPDQHAAVDVAHAARAKCLDNLVLGAF